MSQIQSYNFSAAVVSGTAKTINLPLFGMEDFGGWEPNAYEVSINVTKTGDGGTPTCDIKIQSSPEFTWATAGLINDILAMTQLTATGTETKAVTLSATVKGGRYRRLNIVADAASGDVTFAGSVSVKFLHI